MDIKSNISLASYSTMGLGGPAKFLVELSDRLQIPRVVEWAQKQNLPILMIGMGSNIVWSDEGYPGLVIVNKIKKYEVYQEDETNYYVTVGGGENWDEVVEQTVNTSLSGIEALSLIPGTAGATPYQNVGAYGQEISQTLTTIEAYDTQTNNFVNISAADCEFGYRTSRFKTTDKGRFFITSLTFHLMKMNPMPPFYGSLQSYLEQSGITQYTPLVIRDAVIAIRSSKLPDPALVKNCGSFFANPIISEDDFRTLQEQYPMIPHWPREDGTVKLSAAWLIEQVGFKDNHDEETGMATWPTQPLVLVNEHASSSSDVVRYRQKIADSVQGKFGISMEQEPEFI
jgi:UDP-N-acetylmuramate dehydrogenase